MSHRRVAAGLFVLSLIVRFPFFFPDVIDWDESTYILVSQPIADGHLPYVHTIDMKPPLAYLPYAAATIAFGKHIAAIRVVGALCVFLSAFAIYLIGFRVWNRATGLIASVLTIPGISLVYAGQATMTEHIALPFLLGSLYLGIRSPPSLRTAGAMGALLSAATLVRQNMIFPAALLGLAILEGGPRGGQGRLKRLAAFSLGGAVVVAAVCLPFLMAGRLNLLWTATVLAPLHYSGQQDSLLDNASGQFVNAFVNGPYLNVFMWVAATAGLVSAFWTWRTKTPEQRRAIGLIVVGGAATFFGVLKSGAGYEHYLIQLVPFAAVFAAAFTLSLPARASRIIIAAGAACAVVSAGPVVSEYKGFFRRAFSGEPWHYGPAYQIAEYLNRENTQRKPIYLLTDHIAYWFTDSYPPIPLATHPSAFGKEFVIDVVGATARSGLTEVFALKPEFVVKVGGGPFPQPAANELLETILRDDYMVVTTVQDRIIYRRKR